MQLVEISPTSFQILSEGKDLKTGDNILKCRAKWQHGDIVNGNNRLYTKNALRREIDKLAPKIEAKEVFGMSFHPEGGLGQINQVSHIWEKIWMNEDGQCFGNITILPTSAGKDVQTIIRAGGKLGISSRGVGTVIEKEKDGNKYMEVNESDFRLITPGDFVIGASVTGAGVTKILEQAFEKEEKDEKIQEAQRYNFAIRAGCRLSFNEWKRVHNLLNK